MLLHEFAGLHQFAGSRVLQAPVDDFTSSLTREFAIKLMGFVLRCRDHDERPHWDERIVILERYLYQDWCFRNRHGFAAVEDGGYMIRNGGCFLNRHFQEFAHNMMRDLKGLSVEDALAVAQAVGSPPPSRLRTAVTGMYEGVAMRVVCEYVIVRLVIRLQSCWRGWRVRRVVAAHVHVLHFLMVSRHRFDRCDAPTNDLIQSFVGTLRAQVTDSRDSS